MNCRVPEGIPLLFQGPEGRRRHRYRGVGAIGSSTMEPGDIPVCKDLSYGKRYAFDPIPPTPLERSTLNARKQLDEASRVGLKLSLLNFGSDKKCFTEVVEKFQVEFFHLAFDHIYNFHLYILNPFRVCFPFQWPRW